jgi:hypothetical protein
MKKRMKNLLYFIAAAGCVILSGGQHVKGQAVVPDYDNCTDGLPHGLSNEVYFGLKNELVSRTREGNFVEISFEDAASAEKANLFKEGNENRLILTNKAWRGDVIRCTIRGYHYVNGRKEYTCFGVQGLGQPVRYNFLVRMGRCTIDFPEFITTHYGDNDFVLGARALAEVNEDLTPKITYTLSNTDVVSLANLGEKTLLQIKKPGTVTITASANETNRFAKPGSVSRVLTVGRCVSTISTDAVQPLKIKTTRYNLRSLLNPVTNSTSGITFRLLDAGAAELSGDSILFKNTGNCRIELSAAENDYYTQASKTVTIPVEKDTQNVAFILPEAVTFSPSFSMDLPEFSSAGLRVNYASTNDSVVVVEGNRLRLTGAGLATVIASQAGNDYYEPAPVLNRSVTVSPAAVKITFEAIPSFTFSKDTVIKLTAKADPALPLQFQCTEGPAEIRDGELTCFIDRRGYTAEPVTQNFTINKAEQKFEFQGLEFFLTYKEKKKLPDWRTDRGLPVIFQVENPATALIEVDSITGISAGKTIMFITQPGNDCYEAIEKNEAHLEAQRSPHTPKSTIVSDQYIYPWDYYVEYDSHHPQIMRIASFEERPYSPRSPIGRLAISLGRQLLPLPRDPGFFMLCRYPPM